MQKRELLWYWFVSVEFIVYLTSVAKRDRSFFFCRLRFPEMYYSQITSKHDQTKIPPLCVWSIVHNFSQFKFDAQANSDDFKHVHNLLWRVFNLNGIDHKLTFSCTYIFCDTATYTEHYGTIFFGEPCLKFDNFVRKASDTIKIAMLEWL